MSLCSVLVAWDVACPSLWPGQRRGLAARVWAAPAGNGGFECDQWRSWSSVSAVSRLVLFKAQ